MYHAEIDEEKLAYTIIMHILIDPNIFNCQWASHPIEVERRSTFVVGLTCFSIVVYLPCLCYVLCIVVYA